MTLADSSSLASGNLQQPRDSLGQGVVISGGGQQQQLFRTKSDIDPAHWDGSVGCSAVEMDGLSVDLMATTATSAPSRVQLYPSHGAKAASLIGQCWPTGWARGPQKGIGVQGLGGWAGTKAVLDGQE